MNEIKIFEKYLNNDLKSLSSTLINFYNKLGEMYVPESDIDFVESGSVSTIMWRRYNVFQIYDSSIYNIFNGLKDLTKEACNFYGIDFKKQNYWVQGWFNVNSNRGANGKLGWHTHAPDQKSPYNGSWHGYYGVNIEPSSTLYLDPKTKNILENINENNKMILASSMFHHSMADWQWDGLRISLAYDIAPEHRIKSSSWDDGQHWIPLGI